MPDKVISLKSVKDLVLRRFESSEKCTKGKLETAAGDWLAETLEEPWKLNHPQVSCIPVGKYRWRKHHSGRLGDCFAILDVPGRTHIRIHTGNDLRDTTGCVLVGLRRTYWQGEPVVIQSADAMDRLNRVLDSEGTLEIVGVKVSAGTVPKECGNVRQEEKL